jgi:outer membrane murein-binding lipoprotein Lpp
MRISYQSLVIASTAALLACSLLAGCSSKKKTAAVSETVTENAAKPSYAEQTDTVLTARVQAISRKNRILTLKFPDDKVAKVKVGPQVRNFAEIGVGDTIRAEFHDEVEVFVVGPTGKPVWEEIEEIKPRKGVKPGTAVIRAYEYSATVADIDYTTRKVTLKGPAGKLIRVTGRPDIKRFNEIKTGDTVVARFMEAIDIDITPPERPSSASRPPRRR